MAADHAYLRFKVKDACTRDVHAKQDSGLAKYQFTWETIDVYSYVEYNGMLDLDSFTPLVEVSQGYLKSLHKTATHAFLHTAGNAYHFVKSYKIVGMMRNVVIQGDACNVL